MSRRVTAGLLNREIRVSWGRKPIAGQSKAKRQSKILKSERR